MPTTNGKYIIILLVYGRTASTARSWKSYLQTDFYFISINITFIPIYYRLYNILKLANPESVTLDFDHTS